jgi:hypothetical protein
VHFLRNLLSHVPKAGQDMVAAAMKAVFVIQAPDQVGLPEKGQTDCTAVDLGIFRR